MRTVILALCALALISAPTLATGDPDPAHCVTTIDGVQAGFIAPNEAPIGIPNPAAPAGFTVTVRDSQNQPINNAVVQITVGGLADRKTKFCPSTVTRKNTNHDGQVVFNIGGGGCYKGPNAFVITANSIEIRNFSAVMRADYTGTDNEGIPGLWNLAVTAADFAAFGQAWGGGLGNASCHDYNNDGREDAPDFSIFAQCWSGGMRACH